MGKDKNRSDLLAAGRKTLQQFRSKKDGKGKKLTAKPSSSELDSNADTAISDKPVVVSPLISEQKDSLANDSGAASTGSSAPISEDAAATASLNEQAVVLPQGPGQEVSSRVLILEDCPQTSNINFVPADSLSTFATPEMGMVTTTMDYSVELLREEQDSAKLSVGRGQDSGSIVSDQVDKIMVVEGASSCYIGDMESVVSAVQAGPANGADQGADCLPSKQGVKDNEMELKDEPELGFLSTEEIVETAARIGRGETRMELPTVEVSPTMKKTDVCASSSASSDVKEVSKLEGNIVSAQPFLLPYGSLVNPNISFPGSPPVDPETTTFSQSFVSDSHVIDRLKEQLYLANCAKDMFLFQLDEQSKLQVEIEQEHQQAVHEASSAAYLASEELAKCKSDIKAAVGAKEEMEKNFYVVKFEVVEISTRAEELHAELERSLEASSSQLAEIAQSKALMAALQAEIHALNESITFTVEEKNKIVEEKEFLVTELVQYENSLKTLQVENANLCDSLVSTSEERRNLEEVKDNIVCENKKLLTDLAECKAFLDVLRVENGKLNGNLSLVMEERNELAQEKNRIIVESKTLSLELADCKNSVAGLQREHHKVLEQLKEANSRLEQLSEGNIRVSLLRGVKVELSSSELKKPDDGVVDVLPVEELKLDVFDQSLGLMNFKGQLEEAEKITQRLEDAIQEMHAHVVSFSMLSEKMAAAGVSGLIQAFESKSHHEDRDEEDVLSTESILPMEPILLAEEQTSSLRAILKELLRKTESAIPLVKGERDNRSLPDVSFKELYEDLKQHNSSCEAASIEIDVLYEIIKGYQSDLEAKKVEHLALNDAIRQQSVILEAENSELVSKLGVSQSHTLELEKKMEEMRSSSDVIVSSISKQVDALHVEVAERNLEHEQVFQTVSKLNAFVDSPSFTLKAGYGDGLDMGGFVTASIDATTIFIENLLEKLEACRIDHEVMSTLYKEDIEKLNDMQEKSELAIGVLHKLHKKIEKLVNITSGVVEFSQINEGNNDVVDPLQIDNYDSLIEQLAILLSGRLELASENNKLKTELIDRQNDVAELKKLSFDLDTIMHLVEHVEATLTLDSTGLNSGNLESRLHSLITHLFQKYIEADQQQASISHEMESNKLQGQIERISFLVLQHENEIIILKESLRQGRDDFVALQAELLDKANELEQSEKRVSSIREKLSIAVSKGKGLIVQRDNLKQSLAETSNELEKYVQESQLKDFRLQEVETKLKTYSEAGERVEALESELSYIRNSAAGMRESFLLKDSVLQRIEEILEDLELPENFHSRNIIEKVDWLARSASGNPLPITDWDQKSSVGGGSYSDAGFVATDAWKEDIQQNQSTCDDLRNKYEELQSKFYGLAEQNDMLEQSLMERNNVVQRWEEILDRINMPLQLRSMEPEDRIEWLGSALSEAHHHCGSLQQKVDHLETCYATITADLDESQKRISDFDSVFQAVTNEKEHLLNRLESLTSDYDKASQMLVKLESVNDKLLNEVTTLQEKLAEKVDNYEFVNDKLRKEFTAEQEKLADQVRSDELIEGQIRRLQDLVTDVLQGSVAEDVFTGSSGIECLEKLIQKLVEQYRTFYLKKSVVSETVAEPIIEEAGVINSEERYLEVTQENGAAISRGELEEALHDLMRVKEERDKCLEINQSLNREVELLESKRQEVQDLLNQEVEKSTSLREKLNVAVRKGRSLVQQRDSLKKTIEEVNNEAEHIKLELKQRESSLFDYNQKMKLLESENLGLKNLLADTESSLHERNHSLNMILHSLNGFEAGFNIISDPVEKVKQIEEKWHHLHIALSSSENNYYKVKRSAELLLDELNEVQERNEGLQDELLQLSREKDSAEASKHEAISRFEELSSVHFEDRNKQLVELMVMKTCFSQLTEGFYGTVDLVGNIIFKEMECLYNLETSITSCLEPSLIPDTDSRSLGGHSSILSTNLGNREKFFSASSFQSKLQDFIDDNRLSEFCGFLGNQLQIFLEEVFALKEEIYKYSISLDERVNYLTKIAGIVCGEVISQKLTLESLKENSVRLENTAKERDADNVVIRQNISLLYEACSSSVMQIESWKSQFVGSNLTVGDPRMNSDSSTSVDCLFSEECRAMADRLLFVVEDFIRYQAEISEGGLKDTKATVIDLQKELQEKDIQKDKICVELVNQIKEAESVARSHLQDSLSLKAQLHDVERRLEVMEEERGLLKQRIKELEDGESTLKELDERVRSLNSVLVAKDKEIEALIQALDEEETQMEVLTSKILELEQFVQQRNLDLENVQASRAKALKKLSITVSKFDELHHLSASLLSEVEKLQSQVHERDDEISFLRQEVTRCTNDSLLASQMNNKRNLNEMHDLVTWLNSVASRVQVDVMYIDDQSRDHATEYKELLQKQIGGLLSQLEDLRAVVQGKHMLLQVERTKVEELMRKEESLANTLREKESQLSRLPDSEDSGRVRSSASEIVEVEPLMNKLSVRGTSVASQVRSLRKVNNDQVAIAIDSDPDGGDRLEDEDDDKAHGFKSLTTSRIVPRFTRPVTDMVDGLWVSCDRALMRQPALRLCVIIYWAVMHALLATFVV